MKIISAILTITLLVSCNEEQVFDISFKENERYYLAGYCEPTDNSCTANVDKYIDDCFEESDYDPAMLSSISHIDWTKPQEAQNTLKNADLSAMNKFKKELNDCMANKIGGTYAKNMDQGKASWMTDITVTSSTHPTKFSPKKSLGLLIAIKDNGEIWINKETVKLKDVKSMAKDFYKNTPDIYAVIIADRYSSTADLVSVMDQLKSAGIKNIKISAPIHAYSYDDIETLRTNLEAKYSINFTIKDIPQSTWKIDVEQATKEDYEDLYNYLVLFDEEFSKYPLSFLKKTKIKTIAFVSYISTLGVPRGALPDYKKEIIFFDFIRAKWNKTYKRHVIHHELYHMIEEQFNQSAYWKDPTWIKLNLPDNKYGHGGVTAQGKSNAYPFTHPEQGFVNLYSKSGLEEDKAEIFAGLFIKEEYSKMFDWAKKDKILASKIDYMKSFLKSQESQFTSSFWDDLHSINQK